jgi:hypothetical protein
MSWSSRRGAGEGAGEIAPVDNLTMLHAGDHAHPKSNGSPIAVGYLFSGGRSRARRGAWDFPLASGGELG